MASVWSTPPEFSREPASGYRRETDWYAFGMLAVRCLLSVELAGQLPLAERHTRVLRETDKATARQLSDLERTFVQRLIDPDPSSRLSRGYEVRTTFKEIIASLDRGASSGSDDRPLVVVINPASAPDLIERATIAGLRPQPGRAARDVQPRQPRARHQLGQFHPAGHVPGAASRCAEAAVLLAGRPAHDAFEACVGSCNWLSFGQGATGEPALAEVSVKFSHPGLVAQSEPLCGELGGGNERRSVRCPEPLAAGRRRDGPPGGHEPFRKRPTPGSPSSSTTTTSGL